MQLGATFVAAKPGEWIRNARQYLVEVRSEYRKVTWPSRREYVGGTLGVLMVVGVMTLVLGVVDFALGQLMRIVLP
jgi:preprotein translocase subunit SecE